MDDSSKKQFAISEFTHAINAINYLTSASMGERLVLRAKDVFIIAHHERAVLEGKKELAAAIVNAFPKQSHRTAGKKDGVSQLSLSAFISLFYPLPASVMVGSKNGTMLRVDMRESTKEEAFRSTNWRNQLQVSNMDAKELEILESVKQKMPNVDGRDLRFDSLGGKFKGVLVHQSIPRASTMGQSLVNLGGRSFQTNSIIQFIQSFSTNVAAQEYTRLKIENKEIGEEGPPLLSKEDVALTKSLKKMVKGLDVSNFHKLFVLKGTFGPAVAISTVVAIGNVSTKIFVQYMGGDVNNACWLVARAISYLDRQLQVFNASDQASNETPRVISLPDLGGFAIRSNQLPIRAKIGYPDITLCAFCGKAGKSSLRKCTRCSLAMYCGVDCQRNHWVMNQGPFAHKPFCKGEGRTE